jgi:hypothetical protein
LSPDGLVWLYHSVARFKNQGKQGDDGETAEKKMVHD